MSSIREAYQRLEDQVKALYLIADPGIIKLLCAAIIAHRLPGDPVWLFIVGPSSGGKSMMLNSLVDIQDVHQLDSLTTNTFISGQKSGGKETSLLHIVQNGIFTIKDFSTILNMQKDVRGEIMGQLRKIYDGDFNKSFGTGEQIAWKGKISIISAVTTVIYTAGRDYAQMGERFILYKFKPPERRNVSRKAIKNLLGSRMREQTTDLAKAFKEFLDGAVIVPDTMPQISEELQEEIISLAELTSRARSVVERDFHSQSKDITFAHDPEMPVRLALQMVNLACGLTVINDGQALEAADKAILYKIALDTINQSRRYCLQRLVQFEEIETAGLAVNLGYPTTTVRYWLEDLSALGLVTRIKGTNSDRWTLQKEYRELMSKFENIPMLSSALIDPESINASSEAVTPPSVEIPSFTTETSGQPQEVQTPTDEQINLLEGLANGTI